MICKTRNSAALVLTIAALGLAVSSGRAFSDSKWENHLSTSLIRDIVYRNGELIMATNGGILIYSPATGQFIHYDNTSGLPSNSLTCLLFDDTGDLWIGTEDIGVTRVRLQSGRITVRPTSPIGLVGYHFTAIDMWKGELVYGTTEGAGKFEKGLPGPSFTESHGLPSNIVNDVFVDGDFVWFATDGGAAVLDRLGFITPPADGPPVAYAVEKVAGEIWVGSNNGVWRMSIADSNWVEIGPASESVYSFHWDGQDMWVGGETAFHRYDEAGPAWSTYSIWSFYTKYALPTSTARVPAIVRSPDGDVYLSAAPRGFASGSNLIRADSASVESGSAVFENPRYNGPGENRLIRLSRDILGSVWTSCAGLGVSKLTPSGLWVNYNPSVPGAGTLSNLFANTALLADLDGHKWFSTLSWDDENPKPLDELDDKLDAVFSNDEWTRHLPGSGGGDGYGSPRPQRAVLDPAGNRWFLSDIPDPEYHLPDDWNGINILSRDKSEWLQVHPDSVRSTIKDGDVTHVVFDDDGTAYIALKNYGVQSWYTGGSGYDWATMTDPDDGDLWGHALDARIGVNDELGDAGDVSSLALRSDGVVWIGTGNGVVKYDPPTNTFRKITAKSGNEVGLLSPRVNFVALDHLENLWVATDRGLNRISRDDDNDITAYTTASAYLELSERGIPYLPNIISPLAHMTCTDLLMHPERDLLYIATWGGLSILDVTPAAQQATDLSKVYVYPNPVDGRKGHDELRIDNIDAPVTVEVFNLEGNLVHSQTVTQSEEAVWDLTTQSGFIVSSGVYFVRVDNGQKAVVLTVTVIR
jgi:ligand-binding sensor domain-containing protein